MVTDSLKFVVDTMSQCPCYDSTCSTLSIIGDWVCKIATVIIALANVVFMVRLEWSKTKRDDVKAESERKRTLIETLVYRENLSNLYGFFTELEKILVLLKDKDVDKAKIEEAIQICFSNLYDRFVVFVESADVNLGRNIKLISDDLRDTLVTNISDEAINLYVDRCYQDKVKLPFDACRRNMIKTLFDYKG